jgi:hypothetical protein
MRSLILHIGTEKTGTTSIQRFLSKNLEPLKSQGIWTPTTLGVQGHKFLPMMFLADGTSNELFLLEGLSSSGQRSQAKQAWLKAFREEVLASGDSRWIISSEFLQSRLTSDSEVKCLADSLGDLFDQVEILLYIRSPIDTSISLWSTGLKSGQKTSALPPPTAPYIHRICNHRQTVETWQRYFPRPLLIRLFSRQEFVDGDLLADFCQACGITRGDQLHWLAKEDNQTLSWPAMKLLIELNYLIPRFKDNQINYLRGDLVKYVSRFFSGHPRYAPSLEECQAYEDCFADSLGWIRAHYFPDRKSLFPGTTKQRSKEEDYLFSSDLNDYERSVANLISAVWLDKQEQILKLRKQTAR